MDSVKKESGPAIDRVRRGVEAGLEEVNKPDAAATSNPTSGAISPVDSFVNEKPIEGTP